MEPVTYFVTYGATMGKPVIQSSAKQLTLSGIYLYSVMTHREYTYENIAERHAIKKLYKVR